MPYRHDLNGETYHLPAYSNTAKPEPPRRRRWRLKAKGAMSSSTPAPIGISAIARRLGLSRQRVHILAGQEGFPAPLHELETGRVWRARDIEKWLARNPQYDHSAEAERCPTCGQVVV